MRTRRNGAGLALAAVASLTAVLTLAGCVQPTPRVIPTAEPSSEPVFASDAEALAAAKKAYVAYLSVSDQVATEGGKDPQRFAVVVTKRWLPKEEASARTLAKSQRRQVGISSAADMKLQQRSQSGHEALVSVYVCLDLSKVEFVDADSGLNPSATITAPVPIEVDFRSLSTTSTLLVDRNNPWQGSDFCPQS